MTQKSYFPSFKARSGHASKFRIRACSLKSCCRCNHCHLSVSPWLKFRVQVEAWRFGQWQSTERTHFAPQKSWMSGMSSTTRLSYGKELNLCLISITIALCFLSLTATLNSNHYRYPLRCKPTSFVMGKRREHFLKNGKNVWRISPPLLWNRM